MHLLELARWKTAFSRNPPTYTALGGFTSESKLTDPAGKRYKISGMGLERGGPTAQKGKPI